jgi:uncharacterized protein (DUF1501 family)
MDGLAAVPPVGDPDYRTARGALALPRTLPLDGVFALNPALAPVAGLFTSGEALALHAVATPYRDRSHFDGQNVLEGGALRAHETADGWVNRALSLYGSTARRVGLAVGADIPFALRGGAPVESWSPTKLPGLPQDLVARLAQLYRGDPAFARALDDGVQSEALADAALAEDERGGAVGPVAGAFAKLAPDAGKLLAAPNGPRVAVIECLGWDTHAGQGTTEGRLHQTLAAFAEGIAGLKRSLGPAWSDTVVVAASEFGRTVSVNGTGGTDHGTATASFAFGGRVAGGGVLARWPGLARDRLYQGRDLAPTADLRALLKTVLRDHLQMPIAEIERAVFPGSAEVRPLDGVLRS